MWFALLLALNGSVPPDSAATLFVRVAQSESLHVTVLGRGEPVVFIPGLVGSAYAFRKVIVLLPPDEYRAIVIEPLGFGNSSRPEKSDYSLTAQADRVGAVLDTLGVSNALVVAHSLGASIALRLAYRRPEAVGALLSIEGGPSEEATTQGFRKALRFVSIIKWAGGVKRIRKEMRKGFIAASGDPSWVSDEVVAAYTEGVAADLDATLLAYIRMSKAREPERLEDHLAEITVPVLVLRGTAPHEGGVSLEEIDLFRQTLPAFQADTVSGVGHHIHEERPDAVVRAIDHVRARALAEGAGQGEALEPRLTSGG
jgi:pimeloyl-ACP methyl ester carboxylesterase